MASSGAGAYSTSVYWLLRKARPDAYVLVALARQLGRGVVRAFQCVLIAALGFAIAGVARGAGTSLPPGGTVLSIPATLFGGTTLLDSGSKHFAGGALSGTLLWQVWSDSPNDPLVGNEFAYRFVLDGTDAVHRLTITPWDAALTDVGYGPLASSPIPVYLPSSADRSVSGNTIGFDFLTTAPPPSRSPWLVVFTNSSSTGPTTVNLIDGGIVTVTTVVPEPETYAMILAGIGLLAFVGRRRRRAS